MSGENDQVGSLPTDRYWASCETGDLPNVIRAKALEFRKKLEQDGRVDIWQRATRCYYGLDPDGGFKNSAAVTFGGENGEMVMMRVNHFHSIAQGILTTVAKQRPSFDAKAMSTDTEALSDAQLATGIIEAYYRSIGLEALELECARMGWVLAEGSTALRWNPFIGRVIGKSQRPVLDGNGQPRVETVEGVDEMGLPTYTEQPVTEEWLEREGDVEAQTFSPLEIVRDLDAPQRDLKYAIVPYRENVWDLAARYPDRRDEILAQRGQQRWARSAFLGNPWEQNRFQGDDYVTCWWLYHMPTSACQEGRFAQVCGDAVLVDVPFDLTEVPVYPMIPEIEMTTGSGYSLAFDLLAMCTAYDAIWDVVLSAHDALGLQNVIAAKNADVSVSVIGRGLRLLGYTPQPDVANGGKPEPLQLLAISQDSYKLMELLERAMEVISGLNSVARGEPPANLKSGNALALVQSLAVSFNSGFQGEVVRHHERVATGLLRLLQRHASGQRISEIAGKSQRSAMQTWSKEDLASVHRIAVEIASPLMQSEAGRYQLAETLAQNKMISTPQEFVEAMTAGTVTPMYEAIENRVAHIRTENEGMLAGKAPVVGKYDDHAPHVWEHLGLLDSPEARENDALVMMVLKHIDEHTMVWSQMPLPVALLTKQTLMPPPPPMPMGLPGAPMAPPGPPPPMPPKPGGPPAPEAKPLGQDGGPGMPRVAQPPPNAPPT